MCIWFVHDYADKINAQLVRTPGSPGWFEYVSSQRIGTLGGLTLFRMRARGQALASR